MHNENLLMNMPHDPMSFDMGQAFMFRCIALWAGEDVHFRLPL